MLKPLLISTEMSMCVLPVHVGVNMGPERWTTRRSILLWCLWVVSVNRGLCGTVSARSLCVQSHMKVSPFVF
jgi:hypothetical protein